MPVFLENSLACCILSPFAPYVYVNEQLISDLRVEPCLVLINIINYLLQRIKIDVFKYRQIEVFEFILIASEFFFLEKLAL